MGNWILIVYWAAAPTLGPPLIVNYRNEKECLAAMRIFATTVLSKKLSATCHPFWNPLNSEGARSR